MAASDASTILGCPVIDGRAETPLGVVTITRSDQGPSGCLAWWTIPVPGVKCSIAYSTGPSWEEAERAAATAADRVLRALLEIGERRGRIAGLREAATVYTPWEDTSFSIAHYTSAMERIRARADQLERGEEVSDG